MTEQVQERILIVDDNIPTLRLLEGILSETGYTISIAKSGEEALEVSLKSPYELILLEAILPGIDGYTTCEMLKTIPNTRNIPIIFLSALDDVQSKIKGFEVGGVDFISKPFHEAEIVARIKTHIKRAHANKSHESTVELLSRAEGQKRHFSDGAHTSDQAILESEHKFKTLFTLVPNPILLVRDSDKTITDCNHALADVVGLPRDEILGSKSTDLKVWKNEDECQKFIEELERSGSIDNKEFIWRKQSGEELSLLFSSRIIEFGGEKTIINVGFDYTKLKQAKQQLKDSEEMYRNPVELSPVGVFLFQDGRFRYANPRLCMMFGYTLAEIQGIHLHQIIAASDYPGVKDLFYPPAGGEHPEQGEIRIEFQGVKSSGTLLDVELYASPMDYLGKPAVYGTIIDVTYRNQIEQAKFQSELMYRLITENMKDVVTIIDTESLTFRYLSPSIATLCGYSPDELRSRSLSDLITPESFPQLMEIKELIASKARGYMHTTEYYTFFLSIACKTGAVLEAEVVTSFIRNHMTGNPEMLCLIRDITRQVRSERENEKSKEELWKKNEALVAANKDLIAAEEERMRAYNELTLQQHQLLAQEQALIEANKEKEILLREIHHRVKNNMQVISSLLSLQSRSITDPIVQTLFREAQTRVRSLSLVHELLYKSASLKNINYQMYLHELIRVILDSHQGKRRDIKYKISPIEVQVSIEKAVPCSLVITELLTNSLKYAFPEGTAGVIHIDFEQDADSGYYRLLYRDFGIGFPDKTPPSMNGGFGSMLINGLTKQLSGTLQVTQEDPGVSYLLSFPGDQ